MSESRKLLLRGIIPDSEHWVIKKVVTGRTKNAEWGKYKAERCVKLTCGHKKKLTTWKHGLPLRTHCQECKQR